jgi:hypothetical protein
LSWSRTRAGFRAGIDQGKLNQLVDQLEAGDFTREARRVTIGFDVTR